MKKTVEKLMVGTALTHPGGMTTVLRLYEQSGFLEDVQYMASSREGSLLRRISTFLSFMFSLTRTLLRRNGIRLVHMHVSQRGSFVRKSIAARLCRLFGKKVVWHMHGSEFMLFYKSAPAFFRRHIRDTLNSLDCVIALSESRRRELLTIVPEARITVLYNPCVLRSPLSHPVGESGRVRFLFLGHFCKRKGLYDIIEAMRVLAEPRVHLSLYGGIVGRMKVKSLVRQYGLEKQVHVDGWISGEKKHQAFLDAHVLLLPSYNEGLPMAILEAMSYSLPVISTPVGGIAEAIRDGENGFLVTPGDVHALAERMRRFVDLPALVETMGHAGHRLAAEKFELTGVMSGLESIYRHLLNDEISVLHLNRSANFFHN